MRKKILDLMVIALPVMTVFILITIMLLLMFVTYMWQPIEKNLEVMSNPLETLSISLASPQTKKIIYEETWLYQAELQRIKEQEEQVRKQKISTVAKVIYVEARGECMDGKIAVGATLINRQKSKEFPDELSDIIEAGYADISWVTDEMVAKNPECIEAAERAVAGEDPLAEWLGGPTYYFYNPTKCSEEQLEKRASISVKYQIGDHVFYSVWD